MLLEDAMEHANKEALLYICRKKRNMEIMDSDVASGAGWRRFAMINHHLKSVQTDLSRLSL